MNGFSTEEDSHDGPPAPPFYGQSCCLIEDGERCGRSAGNASFSKRIQKSISQKKLKLDIDKSVSKVTRQCFPVNDTYFINDFGVQADRGKLAPLEKVQFTAVS